jgi:hypothetical protein
MDHPTIEMIDPTELHPLPDVKVLPRWDKQSPEFFGFREDVRLHDIKDPLRITRSKCVIDGELRRLAAVSLRMPKVPCITVPDDEVNTTFFRGIVRRNLTKGQRAYILVPRLKSVLEEAEARRLRNLRKSQQITDSDSIGFGRTLESIIKELGFSQDLLEQARWLHRMFAKDAELRSEWEPKILDMDSPIGLGAAKAGIAGTDADQSQRNLGVLQNVFSTFKKAAPFWEKLSKAQRQELSAQWEKAASELPDDMREAIADALMEVAN